MSDLTAKQQRFVVEYLVDLNATQAAIRAGYSPKTAAEQAHQLLRKTSVAAAISKAQGKRADRTEITADLVLRELWDVATADPNELIQFRRGACKDCWVAGAADEELEDQAHGGALKRVRKAEDISAAAEANPECPTCAGEGSGRAYIFDTRSLSRGAAKLYAGVKVTKDGVEVKMHDRVNALIQVGRHLGMFKDKMEHDVGETLEALIRASTAPKPEE